MIEVEVAQSLRKRYVHLAAGDVITDAIDDGPHCLVSQRPAAGVDAVVAHRIKRFPLRAYQERRYAALDCGHTPRGLGVAWVDAVPDAPNVLPALPACAVEEGELQVAGVVLVPSVADVDHVPGFQPLVAGHRGDKRVGVIAPGHQVPAHVLVVGTAFRFKDQGMADLLRRLRECQRNAVLCVAVNAVGADLLHPRGYSLRPWLRRLTRSLIPHHHGEEHAHAAAMEVGDHLAHAFETAWHRRNHVQLVTVIHAHVWIGGPHQHRVNTAVALFQVVEIAIHGVAAGHRVVEVAVLDHHLRLDKAGLCPAGLRLFVACRVVARANAAFRPPMLQVFEPEFVRVCSATCLHPIFPGVVQVQAVGRRNLLSLGRILRVLRCGCEDHRARQNSKTDDAIYLHV